MSRKTTPEGAVKKAVLEYLVLRGAYALRINVAPVFGSYTSKKTGKTKRWAIQAVPRGTPDIIGCYRGKFIAVECKATTAPTDAQRETAKIITDRGGWFAFACSTAEVEELLNRIDATLGSMSGAALTGALRAGADA